MVDGPPPDRSEQRTPAAPTRSSGTGRRLMGVHRLATRLRTGRPPHAAELEGILELFDEHVYAGVIGRDGDDIEHASGEALARFLGGPMPDGAEPIAFWTGHVHGDDRDAYQRFRVRLRRGEDGEVTYRLLGVDGVTRVMWDRARATARRDGTVIVTGILSDVTSRREVAEKLALASDRFNRLLDVVGEHVYLAVAYPDGELVEQFQGPGADRLLGGAEPDSAMENWEAAVHPDDRVPYDAFNTALAAGRNADVEYRLRGADGITRWVHDRAVAHPNDDGTFEVSGIVSDVTERRRMRAELAQAHAAMSQVVEAMDAHLFTLRIDPDGGHRAVFRGPNREALVGGPLHPGGEDDDAAFAALVHPDDRDRWRSAIDATGAGDAIDIEYRTCGLDGHERIISEQLRPRRDADGTLYYDGVSRDITERRRLEDELLRSMADMREAHVELERARQEADLQGPDGRAHGCLQPAPLQRGRRGGARRPPGRLRAAPARRGSLQARQRRLRPPGRRRGAGRVRTPPPGCARPA